MFYWVITDTHGKSLSAIEVYESQKTIASWVLSKPSRFVHNLIVHAEPDFCYLLCNIFKIKAFKIAYAKKQDDESFVGGALCNVTNHV